ncbi:MAG: hypothetical protein P8Z35_25515, partial [Ignavibacteriaceae bacterium]
GGMKEKLLWTKVIPDSSELIRFGINDWDKVIQITDSAKEDLFNVNPLLYKNDYNYIEFTVKQYRYFAKLRFNLLKCVKLYNEAFKFQNIDKSFTRNNLIEINNILTHTRELAINLSDDFSNLWLGENKTHFLDSMLTGYEYQINALQDVRQKVLNAPNNLDKRQNIPDASSVRLNIKETEGKYFTEWMMINPISVLKNAESDSIDYLKAIGGELNAVPKVTQEFIYDNQTYRWRRTSSKYFDVVDLNQEFPGEKQNVVAYAFANIDSPDDMVVKASIGSTGRVGVIINGKLVYRVRKNYELKDENTFELPLKKGRNNLMLKLYNKDSDWKFAFHILGHKVRNNKNRYKIIE